jgi:hypothetical protein
MQERIDAEERESQTSLTGFQQQDQRSSRAIENSERRSSLRPNLRAILIKELHEAAEREDDETIASIIRILDSSSSS